MVLQFHNYTSDDKRCDLLAAKPYQKTTFPIFVVFFEAYQQHKAVVSQSIVIMVQKESHLRSILKGITWRIIATLTIIIIAYFKTGDVTLALEIGAIEFFIKFALYYLHERAWQLAPRGSIRQLFQTNKPTE